MMAAADTTPSAREKLSTHLADNAHPWTIGVVVVLVILYALSGKIGTQTPEELIGRAVLYFVSAVSFTGGMLALVMLASMRSDDLGKLDKFQVYLILGIGLSTLASAVVILQALGWLTGSPSATTPAPG